MYLKYIVIWVGLHDIRMHTHIHTQLISRESRRKYGTRKPIYDNATCKKRGITVMTIMLKALFNINNVSTLKTKNIWAAWPCMPSVFVIGCKNVALAKKKLHFKSIIKCFKKWKYASYEKYHTHYFPPTDCSVRINHEPDALSNGDIRSFCIPGCLLTVLNIQHRHLDSSTFIFFQIENVQC